MAPPSHNHSLDVVNLQAADLHMVNDLIDRLGQEGAIEYLSSMIGNLQNKSRGGFSEFDDRRARIHEEVKSSEDIVSSSFTIEITDLDFGSAPMALADQLELTASCSTSCDNVADPPDPPEPNFMDCLIEPSQEIPANIPIPLLRNITRKRNVGVERGKIWKMRFNDLQNYKDKHGDCLVPYNWPKDPALAQWVKRMRYQYKQLHKGEYSTLTPSRIEALESIGFVWDSHRNSWDERFADLLEYRRIHGHCHVPLTYKNHDKLALWVKTQRRHRSKLLRGEKVPLTLERIRRLEAIGFQWSSPAGESA